MKKLNLKKLSEKLDNQLAKETKESLIDFLNSKRKYITTLSNDELRLLLNELITISDNNCRGIDIDEITKTKKLMKLYKSFGYRGYFMMNYFDFKNEITIEIIRRFKNYEL